MNDDAKNTLISYRLEKADESLEAARLMLDNAMLTSAMNRIYYAMFYAVQAVLITKNASFSKHGQVKGYFNKEFVHKGLFSARWGKIYNQAFEYRQKFDYVDFEVPTVDMINEFIKHAKDFIEDVKSFLDCNKKNECSEIFVSNILKIPIYFTLSNLFYILKFFCKGVC